MLFDKYVLLIRLRDIKRYKLQSLLAQQQRKTLSIHRCTCPECGLICASTGKLKQHLSKNTCLRRQQEIRERGIEPSDLYSPQPSE